MKILHWNIHGWRDAEGIDNVERVTKLIDDQDPDVVSLVEVDETWGQPMNIERVANQLGYHWTFIPAFEYRQQGGFGNALLSKTPFLSVQQRDLLPPLLYQGTEPTEPRSLLLVHIDSSHGQIAIGSTHFPRFSSERRDLAARKLLGVLSSVNVSWLVCGDFNREADWLDREVIDLAPEGSPATYPSSKPTEAIDYAISKALRISGEAICGNGVSDHLPILIRTAVPA